MAIVLNYAHPLQPDALQQIAKMMGQEVEKVIDIACQIDHQRPLMPQVKELADRANLTAAQWRSPSLVVNPPSFNFAAVALMAEIRRRRGGFPLMLRMRPVPGSTPPRYEVAEIVKL